MTEPPASGPPLEPPTLRRELRAVVTLYVVVSILPAVIGWLFGPRGG
jgi:hypothetical protein